MKHALLAVGKAALWPAKKYIEISAANYERMFGDNIKYVSFWM